MKLLDEHRIKSKTYGQFLAPHEINRHYIELAENIFI